MAQLATGGKRSPSRVLDPGAGTGTLSCAVCEQVVHKLGAQKIHFDAYENDPDLRDLLYKSLLHASKWAHDRGTELTFEVYDTDFLPLGLESLGRHKQHAYDLVISNPPYTKIPASDPRAQALEHVVYGQPNLYALFMAAALPLLRDAGTLVFITPRSYAAGQYFKAFREVFFSQMQPVWIHLFESRKDVFSNQGVLQENVILKATKTGCRSSVTISTSKDRDALDSSVMNRVPISYVLRRNNGYLMLRLPLDEFDDLVIDIVDKWESRLSDYGLDISTGPVVPFRSKEFLRSDIPATSTSFVPLFWMCNVRPMLTLWPQNKGDNRDSIHQFIADNPITRKSKLVLPNRNMVLLRRFSTKEEKRRLIAAPLFQEQYGFERLGIENHVNYIYRVRGQMTHEEVRGLAALLNSALLDKYFRICNGNTQVGAIELRNMPLPPLDTVVKLGRELGDSRRGSDIRRVDASVWRIARFYTTDKRSLERLLQCDA
jgi:adenine-specific DNA-methyltransferase